MATAEMAIMETIMVGAAYNISRGNTSIYYTLLHSDEIALLLTLLNCFLFNLACSD